ncbi:MAG: TonB-dependent receptor plug domain-containing protein [Kiritimatiellae bacterium]|nr:TonB-dependent receptor plug domain-containing protein [Kiritimatiellia bacterium]
MFTLPILLASVVTNSIVVTASPIVQEERNTPDGAEVVYVGSDQLARLSAQDLPTALRHVPGVSVSRYSPIGAFGGSQGGSVYIRGTGESRPGGTLTILRDDVPTLGSFFNHPLMDLTPIDFSESLTVVKTPRPRSVPNAFSAVEMTTWRKRDEGFGGEADIAYGRFNTFLSSLKAGVKEGPFDFAAGVAHRQSEGARKNGEARLDSAFARAGLELGETEYLTFIYNMADSSVEDPGKKGMPTPKYERFNTSMNSYTLRLESKHEAFEGYSAVYVTDGRIRWRKDHFSDMNPASPWGWSKTDWDTYGYRGLYDLHFGDFTLSPGLDVMVEEGRTKSINGLTGVVAPVPGSAWQRETITAPYLGARYDFHLNDEWTLTPSVGTKYYFNDKFKDEWSPGAAVDLGTDEYGVFASYQRGIHYPGLIFLANKAKWGTEDCDAETMDNFNVGFRANLDEKLEARVSVYRNRIRKRLDQDAYGLYHNAGELDSTGLETSLHYQYNEDLSFYSGFSVNHAKQSHAARLPRFTATLGSSYRLTEHLHLDVDAEYVAKMYAYSTRSSEVKDLAEVDGFWTANLRLALDTRVCLPVDGEWYVAVENIFNRHYEYFPDYEMPGTMAYVGMKIRF